MKFAENVSTIEIGKCVKFEGAAMERAGDITP